MTPRFDGLDDSFRPLVEAFVTKLRAGGIPFAVTATTRSKMTQEALYAQGRMRLGSVNALRSLAGLPPINDKENSYQVTKLDGNKSKSMHQLGLAIDLVPVIDGKAAWPPADDPRWEVLGRIGEECGLEWGGRWKDFLDLPHYQRRA